MSKNRQSCWIAFLAVAGLFVASGASRAQNELVVVSWGSDYQTAQRKAYYEPFTKATGIKIVEATGPDAAKIKAMVASGNVEWDVVDISLATALVLEQASLLTPVDYSKFDAQKIGRAHV